MVFPVSSVTPSIVTMSSNCAFRMSRGPISYNGESSSILCATVTGHKINNRSFSSSISVVTSRSDIWNGTVSPSSVTSFRMITILTWASSREDFLRSDTCKIGVRRSLRAPSGGCLFWRQALWRSYPTYEVEGAVSHCDDGVLAEHDGLASLFGHGELGEDDACHAGLNDHTQDALG